MKLLVAAAAVLAASVAGAWVTGSSEDRVVHVTIHHSAFTPAAFEFPEGSTVTFVVHNGDPIDHEFILGDGAVQRRHENGTEEEHGAVPGEVTVPAGETRRTTYTFSEPGRLVVGCHLPGHFDYGMRAEVMIS